MIFFQHRWSNTDILSEIFFTKCMAHGCLITVVQVWYSPVTLVLTNAIVHAQNVKHGSFIFWHLHSFRLRPSVTTCLSGSTSTASWMVWFWTCGRKMHQLAHKSRYLKNMEARTKCSATMRQQGLFGVKWTCIAWMLLVSDFRYKIW